MHALDEIHFLNRERSDRVARFTVAVDGCHHSGWAKNAETVYEWARRRHMARCELIKTIAAADAAVRQAQLGLTRTVSRVDPPAPEGSRSGIPTLCGCPSPAKSLPLDPA